MNIPKIKRFFRKQALRFPTVVIKRKRYLQSVREQYDYSQPTPTIICSTCIGGMISHNLGLQFKSPTVNLWMTSSDLTKFVSRLDEYLQAEFEPYQDDYYPYPKGKLLDIVVYFQHYTTYEEAVAKWNERKARVDKDNLFIITDDKGLTDEEAEALRQAPCKRLVIFTNDPQAKAPYFGYRCYQNCDTVGFYSVRALSGFSAFEREFNYAAWLSGGDDIRL